ncbi:MAG: hypothetical protein ACK4JB_02820 [Reyranella sp.]
MDRTQIFETLAAVGGLCRVVSRDNFDKIVVVDPWLVANQNLIRASQWLLGAATLCILLGLFTSARGVFLGSASNILVLAMLTRLAAPSASGLPTWNDFVVLGDTSEFSIVPLVVEGFRHDDEQFEFRNSLAAAYALVATASVPTRNAADTALKGLTSYTNAQMAVLGMEVLWNMRRKPTGFFAVCTGLGMLAIALMITTLRPAEFSRWMILIGPFAFWTGGILYALGAPKWFRGRIMPHRGTLLMHQCKSLNDTMSSKVLLGLAASGMVSVHVWAVAAFCRHILANIGPRVYDPAVERLYPTPVPRVEHALLVLPLSILCGLALLAHYGEATPTWVFVLVLLVPAILGVASLLLGQSTDIVRHLSMESNSLVFLIPDEVQKAGADESSPIHEAWCAARALDEALDGLFAVDPGVLPHRFTG